MMGEAGGEGGKAGGGSGKGVGSEDNRPSRFRMQQLHHINGKSVKRQVLLHQLVLVVGSNYQVDNTSYRPELDEMEIKAKKPATYIQLYYIAWNASIPPSSIHAFGIHLIRSLTRYIYIYTYKA
jgi:hypothetical protein